MREASTAEEYFRAIEEEFVRRRGAPLLLSPRDWALMASWRESGIPLRIVLQAIRTVFDAFERRAPAGRRINSLSYCRQEVLALHELYRAMRGSEAGRPETGAGGDANRAIARHLGRLLRRVREAMVAASGEGREALVASLAETASELRGLRSAVKRGTIDPRSAEELLRRRDEAVLGAARAGLSETELRDEEEAVERSLAAGRTRMASAAYAATRAAAVAARLRRRLALPRLTLFD